MVRGGVPWAHAVHTGVPACPWVGPDGRGGVRGLMLEAPLGYLSRGPEGAEGPNEPESTPEVEVAPSHTLPRPFLCLPCLARRTPVVCNAATHSLAAAPGRLQLSPQTTRPSPCLSHRPATVPRPPQPTRKATTDTRTTASRLPSVFGPQHLKTITTCQVPHPHFNPAPPRLSRFLLKAYWRARLHKVERFATLILDNKDIQRKWVQGGAKGGGGVGGRERGREGRRGCDGDVVRWTSLQMEWTPKTTLMRGVGVRAYDGAGQGVR